MNSSPPSFGSLLRHHRLTLGWSQERLAERAGLSAEGVSALERGKRRVPRGETVTLLAQALGLEGEARDALERAAAAGRIAREVGHTRVDSVSAEPVARVAAVPAQPLHWWQTVRLRLPLRTVGGLVTALCLGLLLLTVDFAQGGRTQHAESSRPTAPGHLRLEAVWQPSVFEPYVLREPRAIALGRDGNLLIADYARATLLKVTPRGRLLDQWGGPGIAPGEFIRPTALDVDHRGDIYVADTGNNRVQELTAQGQPLRQWSTQPALGTPLNQPQGVAVDSAGDVYVADTGNRRLVKLDKAGKPAWQRSLPAEAVAVDPAGEVMVLTAGEFADPRPFIRVLSPDGSVIRTLSARGEGVSRALHGRWRQWHITVTHDGGVYGTDGASSTLWSFGQTGRATRLSALHLSALGGIVIGPGGDMYLIQVAPGTLVRISAAARVQERWHVLPPAITPFRAPAGITVDRAGNVYLADTRNNRVVELSADGEPLRTWGGSGSRRTLFDRPTGLAVDLARHVYVADSGHDAVDVLSFANRSVTRWTGSLRSPTAIAPGRNGLVYVADSTSLYAFSPAGHVVTRIIARVSGLATDGRGSLVLAAHLPSISKTDWNGKAEAVFSIETGAVDAVAVSEYGTIYALDSSASRLYVIGSGGTVIQRLGGRGSGSGQLSSPRALAVGAGGRVYVADTGNNRVDEFAPSTK